MYSRRNYDTFPGFDHFWIALEGRNYQHIAVVACNCLAECLPSHKVFAFWITLEFIEVSLQVRVCVWVTVGEVDDISVVLKGNRPSESVVIASILSPHAVLIIADVTTAADPAFACTLSFSL